MEKDFRPILHSQLENLEQWVKNNWSQNDRPQNSGWQVTHKVRLLYPFSLLSMQTIASDVSKHNPDFR